MTQEMKTGAAAAMERDDSDSVGSQRLSLNALRAWQSEGFGMFLHFGMSTYDGEEFSSGTMTAEAFYPTRLDVDQWVCTAAEVGMRYAVPTAKHVSGFCLWPSRFTDYHSGNSPLRADLVGEFGNACHRHGIKPGLYYCLWDNHHRFGSITPSDTMRWQLPFLRRCW